MSTVELAPWTKWIGTPNYTTDGVPIYTPEELYFDGTIHIISLLWVILSSWHLLSMTSQIYIIVYVCCSIFMFSTSFAYNIIGCGAHYKPELLRQLDHAAIFIYIAGCYTVLLKNTNNYVLVATWVICLLSAFLKLYLGRKFEIPGIIIILGLGLFPFIALRKNTIMCQRLFIIIACYAIGATFYLNNNVCGAMAYWHLFVLIGTILFWRIIFLENPECTL
jgi:hemolysin III